MSLAGAFVVDVAFSRILARIASSEFFSHEDMLALHTLFPTLLKPALKILDGRYGRERKACEVFFFFKSHHTFFSFFFFLFSHVYRICSVPSGRFLFRVATEKNVYICWDHFCSCDHFFFECAKKGDAPYCKHIIAMRLATALCKLQEETVTDKQWTAIASSTLIGPQPLTQTTNNNDNVWTVS